MKIGDRIKEVRSSLNWTQRELASVSKINYMQISHYESNRRIPTIENAVKLSYALGVSMDWLTKGERCGNE